MPDPELQRVRELLESGSPSSQSDGLNHLNEIVDTDHSVVSELTGAIDEALRGAPLIQMNTLSLLENVSKQQPEACTRIVPSLCRVLEEEPEILFEPTVQILAHIADESPTAVTKNIDPEQFRPALNSSTETRAAAAKVLANYCSPSAVQILIEFSEDEVDSVANAVDEAFTQIENTLNSRFDTAQDEPDNMRDLVEVAATVATNNPTAVYSNIKYILPFVDDPVSRDSAQKALSVAYRSADCTRVRSTVDTLCSSDQLSSEEIIGLGIIGRYDQTAASQALERLVDELGSGTDETQLTAISEVVKVFPDAFESHESVFLHWIQQADPQQKISGISVLTNYFACCSSPGRFGSFLLECLESSDSQMRLAACEALTYAPPHPAPEALRTCIQDSDHDVSATAQAAVSQSQAFEPLSLETDGFESGSALLNAIESQGYQLKYRTDRGIWASVNQSRFLGRMLTAASNVMRNETSHLILPHFQFKWLSLVLLELLATVETGGTVAVYTPYSYYWGSKKDIKTELQSFGLTEDPYESLAATQFSDIFSCYGFHNGARKEYWQGASGTSITILKDLAELDFQQDADLLVVNHGPYHKNSHEKLPDAVASLEFDIPVLEISSVGTKIPQEYLFDEFGPPDPIFGNSTSALSAEVGKGILEDENDTGTNGDLFIDAAEKQTERLLSGKEIMVIDVSGPTILEEIQSAFDTAESLNESPTESLYQKARNLVYWFQSLAVPIEIYDDWIRRKQLLTDKRLPTPTTERIQSVSDHADQYTEPWVMGTIHEFRQSLDAIWDKLEEHNPKFEFLLERIQMTRESDSSLGILFTRQWEKNVFINALEAETSLEKADLAAADISFVVANTHTQLDVDELIITDTLPPAYRAFYLHVGADSVKVMAYGDHWVKYIDSQIQNHIDRIDEVTYAGFVPGDEYSVSKITAADDNKEGSHPNQSERVASRSELSKSIPDSERLVESFWSSLEEQDVDGYQGSRTQQFVQIIDTDGVEHRLPAKKGVIVRDVDGVNRVPLNSLGPGDTFYLFDDRFRSVLYEKFIETQYSERLSEEIEMIEFLKMWWDATRAICDSSDSYRQIWTRLQQGGLEREYETVQGWFSAVKEAERAIDLVENPDLTIGPREAEDIEIIGKVFDKEELAIQSEIIEATFSAYRQFNRQKGKELNRRILELLKGESFEDVNTYLNKIVIKELYNGND